MWEMMPLLKTYFKESDEFLAITLELWELSPNKMIVEVGGGGEKKYS